MTLAHIASTIKVYERLPTALQALVHTDVLTRNAAYYLQAAAQAELTIYVFGTYQPGLEWLIKALHSVKRDKAQSDTNLLNNHRQIPTLLREITSGQAQTLQFVGVCSNRFYEHFEREYYVLQTELAGTGALKPVQQGKTRRLIDVVVGMKESFSRGQPKFWVNEMREAKSPSSSKGGRTSLFPLASPIYMRRDESIEKLQGPLHTSLFAAAFISQRCPPQAYLLRG